MDSGILIAFLNRADQWHPSAVALFKSSKPAWCTSVLVVAETHSWILHRMGEEMTRQLHLFLENLSGLRLLDATSGHHQSVLKLLNEYRGSKLTYVDASSLCFVRQLRIRTVWSTDYHLGLTGARILPRI